MPKIVILGSCSHQPYEVLMMPNKLDPELYAEDHEKAYAKACEKFYPAIEQADVVLVYVPAGELGEHTQRDMEYAMKCGKPITMFPSPQLVLTDEEKAKYFNKEAERR